MTNEEKAREYAAEKFKVNPESKKWNITTTYMSACEWKEHQFKEYLEQRKEKLENAILVFGHDAIKHAKIDLLNEIINELFGGK